MVGSLLAGLGKRMKGPDGKVTAHLPYVLVLIASNLLIYRDYWLGTRMIMSKDFLGILYPLLNFQSDCLQEMSWPLWNPFMNFGYPFVEHYINTAFFPTHLFMGLITGSSLTILHWEILTWIIIGGIGVYLCVRALGHSPLAALISGVGYMFCGQLLTLPHWSHVVYNAACFPYLLLGYHRSLNNQNPFSIMSVLFLAMTILGGYMGSLAYGMYILAAYVIVDAVLRKKILHGIQYLFITFIGAILLSLPKTLPLFNAMRSTPRLYTDSPTADLVNLVNFSNFPSLFVPVKFYFSLYIGELFIIALFYGILRKKLTVNALLVMTVLTGWLFMVGDDGSVSFIRTLSYILPLMKTARNEWINWYYPSLFAIIYLSRYVDLFLSDGEKKEALQAAGLFIAVASILFWGWYSAGLHWQAFLAQVLLAIAWCAVAFMFRKNNFQVAAAAVLVVVEFILVFNRVTIDETPMVFGDQIQATFTHQRNASKSYLDNELVRETFQGHFTDDSRRPSVEQSKNTPMLISGLIGFDSAHPRQDSESYSLQYTSIIDAMNYKKFSGLWHNSQERDDFIRMKDSPVLGQLDGAPLFGLFDREHLVPAGAVLFENLSCSRFGFRVRTEKPAVFLLRQMYDDRWNVYVDNRDARLMHADDFFMATEVGPGEHTLEFVFRDRIFIFSAIASGLTFIFICAVFIRRRMAKRGTGEPGGQSLPDRAAGR